MPQKPNLFALLIGIEKYNAPVLALNGSKNDALKMEAYLQKEADHFNIHIEKLLDGEATKENIVKYFIEHLGKAKKGDTVLFYYSGHGCREKAAEVFWSSDTSKYLETLVCYDGIEMKRGVLHTNLLSDKELRYLIHKTSQNEAHIISIFDCCHSGENTRNGHVSKEVQKTIKKQVLTQSRMAFIAPKRNWEDFIFSDQIDEQDFAGKSIQELLPEGKHIQLAACQKDESAWEHDGEGVFTKNLLDVLERTQGAINYYNLKSRIQTYIKNQFQQTPQIYHTGDQGSELFHVFLNKNVEEQPFYGNISYNEKIGWIMDLGAIHGLSKQVKKVKISDFEGKELGEVDLKKVFPSHTVLSFSNELEAQVSQKGLYKGFFESYLSAPLNIFINSQPEDSQGLTCIEQIFSDLPQNVNRTFKEFEADYTLQIQDQKYYFTPPHSPSFPLVESITGYTPNSASLVKKYLVHMSRWEYVKHLHNPNVQLFKKFPVELRMYKEEENGNLVHLPAEADEIELQFEKQPDGKWGGRVKIELVNHYHEELYCALLYLHHQFGVFEKLINPSKVTLSSYGGNAWAREGQGISLFLDQFLIDFNFPENITYFKLIVSTEDFDVERFVQPALPAPRLRPKDPDRLSPSDKEMDDPEAGDWMTKLIRLRSRNPEVKNT